ncbi:DUF190 domain-containing protein [Moorella sp. Hama-1]|uniref:DUF190 domain-containing protein n=1 Tax=Moorella sp. Hama-1 TaxID=2138101 RepID=UPI000D65C810|nr:DUF190 domain-containing protein [Moorella sp. Hama-1]BCV21560.1 hypothetical protein hamaS1_16290 [Moorella sp. Hama-1]
MNSIPAKLLTIYVGEGVKWQGKTLYHALVLKLKEAGLAGVTVIRGIEGYGKRRSIYSARLIELSYDLPVIVEAVDQADKIATVLPQMQTMVTQGLITVSDVEIIWRDEGAKNTSKPNLE